MILIPVGSWLSAIMISILLAVPVHFLWNQLAPVYFTFLPGVWLEIPYWDCVRLFTIVSFLRSLLQPFSLPNGISKKEG